ncbi:signal peptide-containing protein [Theileria equi strain WA]|uniref:Signal peptide-containing protein n=1 Tax=Theileria equi strain WA TaxID=1537102 RepID=L0AVM3_THEEQ|nr:signal peptide-containing protein [Theileria equi strain WA]AFZ79600.1 signal peptide-containing protein [Theileria equi strain WA]|eukprot:XP_004829266.1 signal peptide-containing protein [Theileria equi strain WA]
MKVLAVLWTVYLIRLCSAGCLGKSKTKDDDNGAYGGSTENLRAVPPQQPVESPSKEPQVPQSASESNAQGVSQDPLANSAQEAQKSAAVTKGPVVQQGGAQVKAVQPVPQGQVPKQAPQPATQLPQAQQGNQQPVEQQKQVDSQGQGVSQDQPAEPKGTPKPAEVKEEQQPTANLQGGVKKEQDGKQTQPQERQPPTDEPVNRGSGFTGAQFNSPTAGQNNSTPMQLATGTSGESTESTNTSPSSETPTGKGVKLDVASSSTSQTGQSGNSQTNTTDYKEHVPKQNDFFDEVVDGGATLWKATGNEKCVKVILDASLGKPTLFLQIDVGAKYEFKTFEKEDNRWKLKEGSQTTPQTNKNSEPDKEQGQQPKPETHNLGAKPATRSGAGDPESGTNSDDN